MWCTTIWDQKVIILMHLDLTLHNNTELLGEMLSTMTVTGLMGRGILFLTTPCIGWSIILLIDFGDMPFMLFLTMGPCIFGSSPIEEFRLYLKSWGDPFTLLQKVT